MFFTLALGAKAQNTITLDNPGRYTFTFPPRSIIEASAWGAGGGGGGAANCIGISNVAAGGGGGGGYAQHAFQRASNVTTIYCYVGAGGSGGGYGGGWSATTHVAGTGGDTWISDNQYPDNSGRTVSARGG